MAAWAAQPADTRPCFPLATVVRVSQSSEAERLDSQRLQLSVGEAGTVLAVNAGAGKSLFGFTPQVWRQACCTACSAPAWQRAAAAWWCAL